jgi:hypothetical protein
LLNIGDRGTNYMLKSQGCYTGEVGLMVVGGRRVGQRAVLATALGPGWGVVGGGALVLGERW